MLTLDLFVAELLLSVYTLWRNGRYRIVVSNSRCGRDNPGWNPHHSRGCQSMTR